MAEPKKLRLLKTDAYWKIINGRRVCIRCNRDFAFYTGNMGDSYYAAWARREYRQSPMVECSDCDNSKNKKKKRYNK